MNAKTALCIALLEGRVLNVKNCFNTIGLTNCSREISRMIEKPFSVSVSRTPMTGKSRYGQSVSWVNFRLNSSPHNLEGMEKMREYIKEHSGEEIPAPKPKPIKPTKQESTIFSQSKMF